MDSLFGSLEFSGNWNKFGYEQMLDCLSLIPDKDLMIGIPLDEQLRWMAYLYSAPKIISSKVLGSRSHVFGLYDPFAKRKKFPAGLRYCVNPYVGCSHQCRYCYIIGYIPDSFSVRLKNNYRNQFEKDLSEIGALGLPPSPLHLSNSTDPLQSLEKYQGDTLWSLDNLVEHQSLFSTITILTKNPELLASREYLDICKDLPHLRVEVSCSFFDEETKTLFESNSPSVKSRLTGMELLRKANIRIALRLDPLFPRNPLPREFFKKERLEDYNAPIAHTEEEIKSLITYASEIGCYRVIISPVKLTFERYQKTDIVNSYLNLYRELGNGSPIKKGYSYRLSDEYFQYLSEFPEDIASRNSIELFHCKHSLITTI